MIYSEVVFIKEKRLKNVILIVYMFEFSKIIFFFEDFSF